MRRSNIFTLEAAVRVIVNGLAREIAPNQAGNLLRFLRSDLGLHGPKPGCGEGECGACTVLVDGAPLMACRTQITDVSERSVITVEGLASADELHRVQEALIAERACQCGYCMPGMAVRGAALLAGETDLDDHRIVAAMNPNLCRCGCYQRIVRAIRRAATSIEDGRSYWASNSPGCASPLRCDPMTLTKPKRPWDLSSVDQRDWFEVLGDGLVVVWPPAAAVSEMWATNGGAWLHIAPSGRVMVFVGKVDVGQDNLTAFALLAAEELFVPLGQLSVVLGDTDLCPFDIGTFGSRSMPDAGEAVRRAAAGARQTILQLAADRFGAQPEGSSLTGEGAVRGPLGDLVTYGELVSGLRRVEVMDGEPLLVASDEWRVAGIDCACPDRESLVRGTCTFVSDLELPGMLHGAVLRPPTPDAALLSVDTEDLDQRGIKLVQDGSFVAIVAGDPGSARRALSAVRPRWDDPPAGPDDLEGYLRSHPSPGEGWERAYEQETGDVNLALQGASTTLSATYTTSYLAHTPLETRAAVAHWESGRLTVWTGTQVPFGVRRQVAEAFQMDEANVRVIVPPTGGGFGGRHGAQVAIEAARLAREVGHPVKVHWNRAEEFQWGGLRPMAIIDVRSGLDEAGSVIAWDFTNINAGAAGIQVPYAFPNVHLSFQPANSPVPQVSYRALAATANHFARESQIDELAHSAGADPLEFRLRHLADERLAAVAEAAAARFEWDRHRRGTGIAVGLEKGGRVATCAEVIGTSDSIRVDRIVTAYECGAVPNVDTVVNQIEGATVMALGGALFESVAIEHGRIVDPSLAKYRVPRFEDVPAVEVMLLNRRDLPSAGAGETPMVAVAPAVANAIFSLSGKRIRSLPLLQGEESHR